MLGKHSDFNTSFPDKSNSKFDYIKCKSRTEGFKKKIPIGRNNLVLKQKRLIFLGSGEVSHLVIDGWLVSDRTMNRILLRFLLLPLLKLSLGFEGGHS